MRSVLTPARRQARRGQPGRHGSPRASAAGSPGCRSGWCSASCPARCSASSSSSTVRVASCCSSRRTSSRWSASSRSTPADFRLWVCLHEVTHRVQFTAVPWLRQHMHDEVNALTDATDTDPAALKRRLSGAVGELVTRRARAGRRRGRHGRHRHSRAAHGARPHHRVHVAGRGTCRVRHERRSRPRSSRRRRRSRSASRRGAARAATRLDRLLRRLLGLDAKTRQYVDGSAFVRTVIERVGVDGFNAIWTSRQTLPTKAEIAEPLTLDQARPRLTPSLGLDFDPASVAPDAIRRPFQGRSAVDGAASGSGRRPVGGAAVRRRSRGRRVLGRRRLARPGRRRRVRGAAAGAVALVTVDHGLQDGSAAQARAGRGARVRARVRPGRDRAGGRRPRRWARGGRPDRPVRRPGRDGAARSPPTCCSATRSTTRPRRCCSASAADRAPASIAGMRARSGRYVRPLLGVRRATTVAACAALGLDVLGRPAQR